MLRSTVVPAIMRLKDEEARLKHRQEWYISEGLGETSKAQVLKLILSWINLKLAILDMIYDI